MKQFSYILMSLILLPGVFAFGQIENYRYKRSLPGTTEQWHKIELPDRLFDKLNLDFSDIRIVGFTEAGDTLEAPYLLTLSKGNTVFKEIHFKVLNKSQNANGYYFTFEVPAKEPVNQIDLNFDHQNFDWQIMFEGSQNQLEWYSILNNYRILSINNELTDYKFTKLAFPDSKFRFYRLCVKSHENPKFLNARIIQHETIGEKYRNFKNTSITIKENKERRQTIVDIELENTVPVAFVQLFVQNGFDYYRPVSIRYLTDSVKTDQGWKYNYANLSSGILTSIENPGFSLPNTILKKLRIVVDNQSNQPLTIDSVVVKGYDHHLVARFQPKTAYYLYYGNQNALRPRYDIERFAANIPELISVIEPDEETVLYKEKPQQQPLFVNEAWLWLIMVVIILALGWFTLGMMKKTKS